MGRLDGSLLLLIAILAGSLIVEGFGVVAAERNSGAQGQILEEPEHTSTTVEVKNLGNLHQRKLTEKAFANDSFRHDNITEATDQHDVSSASYRSNAQLLEAMKDFAIRCSKIARIYSIGKSVRGVPLMVLEISDKPGEPEPEPAFKYVGNMHGDEPSGRELTLYLAEWLCSNYQKDSLATFIVQNVHLHLLPSMNPDGFEQKQRPNANGFDLNRDFPDQFSSQNDNESERQPETIAVMEWTRVTHFLASASLHEGALVASYGWDGTATGRAGYAMSPDDDAFKYMASLYAEFNPLMKKSAEFSGGVTNGAAWYPLYGGMQDWNYIHGNCFEITLEMNDDKWPDLMKIPALWEQHKQSMLMLVASLVQSGLHGRVISSRDGRPLPAIILVTGNTHAINASSKFGDYHRILLPGQEYEVTAILPGYANSTRTVVLAKDRPTTVDFILDPISAAEESLEAKFRLRGSARTSNEGKGVQDHVKEVAELCDRFMLTNCASPPLEEVHAVSLLHNGNVNKVSGLNHENTDSRLLEDGLAADIIVDHLMISAFGGTAALVAALLYIVARWRGGFRLQATRQAVRRS